MQVVGLTLQACQPRQRLELSLAGWFYMRAVYTDAYAANLSGVYVGTVQAPQHLAAGTLLIAVAASSVNPIDYKVLDGSLASVFPLKFPHTLGNDFVGTVVNVSVSGSERFRIGDAVWGFTGSASRAGPFAGAWATLLAVDEAKVALLPTGSAESSRRTNVELATLPCVSLTMYQALELGASCFTPTRKAANRSVVVVTSGQGGTGLVGIQLAKALGASHVVTSAGSSAAAALLRSLGADTVVDFTRTDLLSALDADSVDVFIDNYGYDADRSLATVRTGGAYISIVHRTPSAVKPGVANASLTANASRGDQLALLGGLVEAGQLRPVVNASFSMDAAVAALTATERGAVGKIGLYAWMP